MNVVGAALHLKPITAECNVIPAKCGRRTLRRVTVRHALLHSGFQTFVVYPHDLPRLPQPPNRARVLWSPVLRPLRTDPEANA